MSEAVPEGALSRDASAKGSLVVVGTGIQLGRHISERAVSEIDAAEVLFTITDGWALEWIRARRADVVSLHELYATGKDRRRTYREMHDRILGEIRNGRQVCLALYGHPGIFAEVPHRVMEEARQLGHRVRMEPGVSADGCLYADLGLDPGKRGMQSFEATQFLVFDHTANPAALLVLWQVALAGDLSCARFHAERDGVQALVNKLRRWYPADTECILYEAAQIPVTPFRADRLRLDELPDAEYRQYTTLVIPPAREMEADPEGLADIGADVQALEKV